MQGRRYRVKPGDSLSSIAKAELGNSRLWPRIFVHNNRRDVIAATHHTLLDPDKIYPGQLLLIPLPDHGHGASIGSMHPRQATHPRIVPHTEPTSATAMHAASALPHGGAPAGNAPAAGAAHHTKVNSFPFKYKLNLIPKQKIEGPNYTAEIAFEGVITIWRDKQIPIINFTDKALEATAKYQADGVLRNLVGSSKLSWEWGSNKASFESLMTINAHGLPPNLVSVGIVMSSDKPVPALRFKFQAPALKGKVGDHLYHAENVQVTIDLRGKPGSKPPDNTRRPDPIHVGEPVRVRVYVPEHPEEWWQRAGHWVGDHKVEIGVSIVVLAVVASNFATAGADAEVDPAVVAWGARVVQAARAARMAAAAAPAFAH